MKIQKGIVKYKDRNDIVCTYGITDDGKQYYFLGDTNDKKFSNGNRVASTLLVEAIDPMVKASNIGIIDDDGNIVIPFENKSIRLVNDSIIVVEKAEPVSQSVKDAIEMRNDPLSATKLVSTPAAVKDKLYAQMGNDSRFVFNDQFSEATVCDINGNNLVNDEYYSFIAVANNKLYFSKNTVDAPIVEYSLLPPEVQSDVTPKNDGTDIDVSNINVESNVVENAMSDASDTSIAPPTEDLNVAKNLGGEITAIPEVPAIPDISETDTSDIALPQVEEDEVVSNELESVAPVIPPEEVKEDEDILMDYDDSLSKIVDETAIEEEKTNEVVPPVEEDILMDYDDSLSKVVDETAIKEEKTNEVTPIAPPVEEDVLMNYDDSLSKVVDETAIEEEKTNEVVPPVEEDVLMDYDESLSTVSEETMDEVKYNDGDNSNMLEEVPPVTDLSVGEAAQNDVVKDEMKRIEDEMPNVELPNTSTDDTNSEVVKEEITDDISNNTSSDSIELENKAEENVTQESNITEEVKTDLPVTEESDDEDPEGGEKITPTVNEELDKDISAVVDEISGDVKNEFDIDSLLSTNDNDDLFTNTVKPDRIDTSLDDFDAFTSDYKASSSDSIMTDIAKSMTELMKQNREQRALLAEYQEKFDVLNAQKKVIVEKYKDQVQKLENVASKYRNLETTASRLETRNQLLESKITEQDRLISAQERELGSLRPQLQGKENLVKILADAKALLGDDESYI